MITTSSPVISMAVHLRDGSAGDGAGFDVLKRREHLFPQGLVNDRHGVLLCKRRHAILELRGDPDKWRDQKYPVVWRVTALA